PGEGVCISRKFGFTLAEVLITLGIIGVVAAITLPTLIDKYQKQVTVNKLKRSYTTISQMFNMARKDYGDPNEWSFDFGEYGSSNFDIILTEIAKNYFLPYLDVIDNCGTRCIKIPYNSYKFLNNTTNNLFRTNLYYTMFLKDESFITFSVNNNGVKLFDLLISVDINGLKGPNIEGKDVFSYNLQTSGVAKSNFWGLTGAGIRRETLLNDSYRGCNKNASGQYCGALIQYDGWKIKDDYPW
uniref:DUF6613 domain-containing protein n=1 Tax=Candidatus Scatousia sp. TaxID=3085663 RepID=UPI0040278577